MRTVASWRLRNMFSKISQTRKEIFLLSSTTVWKKTQNHWDSATISQIQSQWDEQVCKQSTAEHGSSHNHHHHHHRHHHHHHRHPYCTMVQIIITTPIVQWGLAVPVGSPMAVWDFGKGDCILFAWPRIIIIWVIVNLALSSFVLFSS